MAKWTEEEEARLASLYLKVPLEVLVKEFPRHSISAIIKKGNKLVYGTERKWSPYEIDILVNEFEYLSVKKIRALYLNHRSKDAIYKKAQALGIHPRLRGAVVYNETFWDVWSPDLAYALGLLMTDGSVANKRGGYYVSWILHRDDALPLFVMRRLFGGSMRELGNCFELLVYGRWIIEKLKMLGFDVRKKKDREGVPNVPSKFVWHFIRGLVDGDGWISYRPEAKRFCVGFVGKEFLVDWLQKHWSAFGYVSRELKQKDGHLPRFVITIYGAKALKMCEKMYQNCGLLFVPRKRNACMEACRDYSQKGSRVSILLSETPPMPE